MGGWLRMKELRVLVRGYVRVDLFDLGGLLCCLFGLCCEFLLVYIEYSENRGIYFVIVIRSFLFFGSFVMVSFEI